MGSGLVNRFVQGQGPLLENKIQPSKFEDLIGFMKCFMYLVDGSLAGRGELPGIVQNGGFLQEGG